MLPVWIWLQNPKEEFITCAHIDKLALRDSVRSRQIIESPWFQRNWGDQVRLQPGYNQKSEYRNTENGYRIATSISGRATGDGFSTLIVDDPYKAKDISSKAAMEEVIEWWTGTMPSRANSPDAKRIVIHQRLSQSDLIQYIKDNDSINWEVITLPFEYVPTTFVSSLGWSDPRKEEGDIICPERFPPHEVKRLKNNLGTFGFEAQYQQNPAPVGGGLIQKSWLKYYGLPFNEHTMKNFDLVIQSWDLAFGASGDFTVGQVWGKAGPDKYLLDQAKGKWTFTEQLQKIRQLKSVWPQTRVILVENKANGAAVIDTLRKSIPGLIPINPREIGGGDKEVRLSACALDFEASNVYFPSSNIYPWVQDLIDELTSFPKSKHDDQVDALSQALNWLATKSGSNVALIPSEQGLESLGRIAPKKGFMQQKTSGNINFSEVSRRMTDQNTLNSIRSIFD